MPRPRVQDLGSSNPVAPQTNPRDTFSAPNVDVGPVTGPLNLTDSVLSITASLASLNKDKHKAYEARTKAASANAAHEPVVDEVLSELAKSGVNTDEAGLSQVYRGMQARGFQIVNEADKLVFEESRGRGIATRVGRALKQSLGGLTDPADFSEENIGKLLAEAEEEVFGDGIVQASEIAQLYARTTYDAYEADFRAEAAARRSKLESDAAIRAIQDRVITGDEASGVQGIGAFVDGTAPTTKDKKAVAESVLSLVATDIEPRGLVGTETVAKAFSEFATSMFHAGQYDRVTDLADAMALITFENGANLAELRGGAAGRDITNVRYLAETSRKRALEASNASLNKMTQAAYEAAIAAGMEAIEAGRDPIGAATAAASGSLTDEFVAEAGGTNVARSAALAQALEQGLGILESIQDRTIGITENTVDVFASALGEEGLQKLLEGPMDAVTRGYAQRALEGSRERRGAFQSSPVGRTIIGLQGDLKTAAYATNLPDAVSEALRAALAASHTAVDGFIGSGPVGSETVLLDATETTLGPTAADLRSAVAQASGALTLRNRRMSEIDDAIAQEDWDNAEGRIDLGLVSAADARGQRARIQNGRTLQSQARTLVRQVAYTLGEQGIEQHEADEAKRVELTNRFRSIVAAREDEFFEELGLPAAALQDKARTHGQTFAETILKEEFGDAAVTPPEFEDRTVLTTERVGRSGSLMTDPQTIHMGVQSLVEFATLAPERPSQETLTTISSMLEEALMRPATRARNAPDALLTRAGRADIDREMFNKAAASTGLVSLTGIASGVGEVRRFYGGPTFHTNMLSTFTAPGDQALIEAAPVFNDREFHELELGNGSFLRYKGSINSSTVSYGYRFDVPDGIGHSMVMSREDLESGRTIRQHYNAMLKAAGDEATLFRRLGAESVEEAIDMIANAERRATPLVK